MEHDETDGVRVVLSAPQLVAVLARQSISQTEMAINRLWGGLAIVGGVLEMAGAAALCVAPEPTGLSKLGCVVFGVHGSDTAAAGLRQIWTAHDTTTLMYHGASKLAEAMKAPPEMADNIGLSLDIAVPFGLAGIVKAVRVSSITMGRIELMRHEATAANPRLGGHTLLKHVGRTEAQLRERLRLEPRRDVVSSFYNLASAEWALSEAARQNAQAISTWAKFAPVNDTLIVRADVGRNAGYGVIRDTAKLVEMRKVKIVLKMEKYNGMPYYIFTSYLEM